MAAVEQWYIGSTAGEYVSGIEGDSVEICAEDTADADWFEWDGNQMIKADNIQIKCVDDIICSCKNLDISGFDYQWSRNGRYVLTDSLLNGRIGFKHHFATHLEYIMLK